MARKITKKHILVESEQKTRKIKRIEPKKDKEAAVKLLEQEVLNSDPEIEVEDETGAADSITKIMFRIPCVDDPLIGTPKQVQDELNSIAQNLKKYPRKDYLFDKIHLYMHGYLVDVAMRKFPYIQGLQTVDVYQEALIALRFKAIPGFKEGRGCSFLNFAKLCIRRHLITLLHASKNRKKDQSINRAISLESSPFMDEGEEKSTYSNIIADGRMDASETIETDEAYLKTKEFLTKNLSPFERSVLEEYLSKGSYKEIATNLAVKLKKRCRAKSIDNALLRIRKKALSLRRRSKLEDLPIFIEK